MICNLLVSVIKVYSFLNEDFHYVRKVKQRVKVKLRKTLERSRKIESVKDSVFQTFRDT